MSPKKPAGTALEASAFDLLTALKRRLLVDRDRINDAIGSYPAPIPACDAQFNHLLEERRRRSRALNLIDTLLNPSDSAPAVIQTAEALIAQLVSFDDVSANRVRSAVIPQSDSKAGGRSDPS